MSGLVSEIKSLGQALKYEPVPLVEAGWNIIKDLPLKPLNSFEGYDLASLSKRIESPMMSCRMEHYFTDKAEKISLGWYFYMPKAPRMTQTFVICPADDYDLPVFVSDLDQRAHGASLIVDLWPTLDLTAEEWYKEKYYDAIAPLYAKYWDLGPQKIIFHPDMAWWRMLSSVYEINIELPNDRIETIVSAFSDYLKYYIELYRKAQPITDKGLKERIARTKKFQRKWFRDRDPAKGVIIRALGEETEKKIMVGLLEEGILP